MPDEVKGTNHVEGEDRGDIILYALSTCGWCKKTRAVLDDLGVAYRYVDVDELDLKDMEKVNSEVKKWNPRCSYPTLIIDNEKCIVGFDENKLREAVGK